MAKARPGLGEKTVVTVVILSASIVASLYLIWNDFLPNYRPSLEAGESYGIDVSNHQSEIDWDKAAADDIEFAYIKATEGSEFVDHMFESHWSGARASDIQTGAYHFFSFCSPAGSQADNFLETIPTDATMLPTALDLEFTPFCDEEPSVPQAQGQIQLFLDRVEAATGQAPIIYVGHDFNQQYDIKNYFSEYGFWQLRYFRRPSDPQDVIWQVGHIFHVEGAPGKVDLNVADLSQLDGE